MATLKLIAVGDISLACQDGRDPFEYVSRYLTKGDIVFANLECVLCESGPSVEKEITLRASPRKAQCLRQAGIDVVNVANNHALDFGPAGLAQTLHVLRQQGILAIGAAGRGAPSGGEIIERKGLKVGFLGYCAMNCRDTATGKLINPIDHDVIIEQLRELRPRCDVAVVSLHWGIEYLHYPSPTQMALARELIANGAGLVLGHHPLVVQGIESRGGGLIAYSLGSFQFRPRTPEAHRSFILLATIGSREVKRHRLIPVQIDQDNAPRLIWNEPRRQTLQFVEQISTPIVNNAITERWWLEQMATVYLRRNLEAWKDRIRRYGVRHFLLFMRWLVSAFTIRCYFVAIRKRMKGWAGLHE